MYEGHVTTLTNGHILYTACTKCKEIKLKSKKEKMAINFEIVKIKRLTAVGIPKRFIKSTFNSYDAKDKKQQHVLNVSIQYALSFNDIVKTGTSLIFCGSPGTGKTHLSCAIAKTLHEKNYNVVFTSALKCIRKVRQAYNADHKKTEQDVINDFVKLDLLILDEVGMQLGTQSEKVILFEIINDRYANEKPTILISNLNTDEISEYVGKAVIDRMNQNGGAVIVFDWESYRGKK